MDTTPIEPAYFCLIVRKSWKRIRRSIGRRCAHYRNRVSPRIDELFKLAEAPGKGETISREKISLILTRDGLPLR